MALFGCATFPLFSSTPQPDHRSGATAKPARGDQGTSCRDFEMSDEVEPRSAEPLRRQEQIRDAPLGTRVCVVSAYSCHTEFGGIRSTYRHLP